MTPHFCARCGWPAAMHLRICGCALHGFGRCVLRLGQTYRTFLVPYL